MTPKDSQESASISMRLNPHFDHVTSHNSQGLPADRVLINRHRCPSSVPQLPFRIRRGQPLQRQNICVQTCFFPKKRLETWPN
jgi:hypothetical protein